MKTVIVVVEATDGYSAMGMLGGVSRVVGLEIDAGVTSGQLTRRATPEAAEEVCGAWAFGEYEGLTWPAMGERFAEGSKVVPEVPPRSPQEYRTVAAEGLEAGMYVVNLGGVCGACRGRYSTRVTIQSGSGRSDYDYPNKHPVVIEGEEKTG